ncbi:hypothetical protein JHK84_032155 [Glycine max]|nr:hypothetical protein JHK84_032155 [Glycine max]
MAAKPFNDLTFGGQHIQGTSFPTVTAPPVSPRLPPKSATVLLEPTLPVSFMTASCFLSHQQDTYMWLGCNLSHCNLSHFFPRDEDMPKLPKKSQDSVIAQACDYPIRLPSIPDSAEYALHGQLLEKADTYNYGIVVLEIISGPKSIDVKVVDDDGEDEYLLRRAWKLYERGMHLELVEKILDPNKYDAVEVKKVIDIALLCTQEWATMRPTMFELEP